MLDVLASSPAIVIVSSDTVVSIPSPPVKVSVPPVVKVSLLPLSAASVNDVLIDVEPPNETAEPLIVIEEFVNAELGIFVRVELEPSILATNSPVVIVKLPVDAPVNVPVPTLNTFALSSKPINAFASSPLSITIPASPLALPVVPVPNSTNLSLIVVFVVSIVVVVPLTVRLPAIVTLSGNPTVIVP